MRPLLLLSLSFCTLVVAAGQPNFTQCLNDLQSGIHGWQVIGAIDSNGHPVANASDAAGLTYDTCKIFCGSGHEAFDWHTFTQQFTSWFLPWLPLMSQLPYGAKDSLSNFISLLLMVGSPALAAYSLALAVIGNRWMVKRFMRSSLHHTYLASQTLGNLQQVYLRLPQEEHVLPSLIILPENRVWWKKLASGLDYPVPKWTVAAIMSVLYLILTDVFSWAVTLGSSDLHIDTTGESIGSLWLCLLPIVIGYLQLSPKSDSDRVERAFRQANKRFYTTTDNGELEPGRASLSLNIQKAPSNMVHEDETCSAPIFFYARFFTWIHVARVVTDGFDAASHRASHVERVRPRKRMEIIDYCRLRDERHNRHSYEIFSIFLRSVFLALFLQWGTTGAAIVAIYLTPTKGLGCRSFFHIIYGLLATLVWLFCVISSILSHSYETANTHTKATEIIGGLSVAFRLLAKTVAAMNTIWLFLQSLLQFSNIFDTCYCNGSVIGLGKHAYVLLKTENASIKLAWAGGLIMSFLTAIAFIFALNLLRKGPELQASSIEMMNITHCDNCQPDSTREPPSPATNASD